MKNCRCLAKFSPTLLNRGAPKEIVMLMLLQIDQREIPLLFTPLRQTPLAYEPRRTICRARCGSSLYVNLPSFSAQALATAEFGFSVPGNVAQPPFSMSDRRSQDKALLNATSFAAASVCCWNFSTQIGASTATTAVSARWVAIRSAALPSVHPSDENPTTVNATAPATAPHTAGFTPGWIFMSSPWLGRRDFSDFKLTRNP